MSRLTHAWRALQGEEQLAAVAALALLVTMFLPWYGLQSLNPKTHEIYSHSISAFGDVSFVEAAIFLVAAAVIWMLFARAEGRTFHLPGGDGTVVLAAGGWAALLIFYRVFSRPAGDGYPVGIEWGFFLAFVAAGALAYAGWRMRLAADPEPPLIRVRATRRPRPAEPTVPLRAHARPTGEAVEPFAAPAASVTPRRRTGTLPPRERAKSGGRTGGQAGAQAGGRPPYPPAPPEQLSFEDPPGSPE